MDLKAVFYTVNMIRLCRIIEQLSVSQDVIEKIQDTYKESKCYVKLGS